jgi:diguanylate cyclase (GGDEF)-like protein/PAS domain S-box-containing protein
MSDFSNPEIYRTVLESLHTGVYLVDRERRIVFWNDGAERITGHRRHDVLGRFCRDNILVHCDENNKQLCGDACPLTEVMRDGHSREAEVYLLHRDGHRVAVLVRAVPIRDGHGAVIGAAESFSERDSAVSPERRSCSMASQGKTDDKTGLPDHAFTESLLRESLVLFKNQSLPFGVIRIQVDQLQEFKAQHGQGAADSILRVVAETLKNTLRRDDMLGRWAEDQFLAILPFCSSLEKLAARWQGVVNSSGIPWWGDHLSVTISIGGTRYQAEDTLESILQRTLQALQHSMAEGGNCYTEQRDSPLEL